MRRVAILVLIACPSLASGLDLCLENSARLDPSTLQVFRTELSARMSASNTPAAFTDCHPGAVSIALVDAPPEEETSALGATRRRDGRLVGEIEVFVGPTARIVGTRLPAPLGRALARVATHELGHWLNQDATHAPRGLMMERLSAAHLLVPDRRAFDLPAARQTR